MEKLGWGLIKWLEDSRVKFCTANSWHQAVMVSIYGKYISCPGV
jgi:hypothetical protein